MSTVISITFSEDVLTADQMAAVMHAARAAGALCSQIQSSIAPGLIYTEDHQEEEP
jgi:hypothetical protein